MLDAHSYTSCFSFSPCASKRCIIRSIVLKLLKLVKSETVSHLSREFLFFFESLVVLGAVRSREQERSYMVAPKN